ncbi:MAG: peptidoglycan bridge formation glycyltransferase FemA/FemB family protein, partial [Patescibacteria group bacterium]
MKISEVRPTRKDEWNRFVRKHYPPVGAFMQTWEWGTFQEKLGKKAERYFVAESREPIAAFTLVHHALPFGFSYGYVPRGPVIASPMSGKGNPTEIFSAIRAWAAQNFPRLIFVRLEPPLSSFASGLREHGFSLPPYYVQPRYNLVIPLKQAEEDILAHFHPTTRSNIRRAEKRGASVILRRGITEREYGEFFSMIRDTIRRNSGKNAYPSRSYFHSLVNAIPPVKETYDSHELSLGIFCGYEHG